MNLYEWFSRCNVTRNIAENLSIFGLDIKKTIHFNPDLKFILQRFSPIFDILSPFPSLIYPGRIKKTRTSPVDELYFKTQDSYINFLHVFKHVISIKVELLYIITPNVNVYSQFNTRIITETLKVSGERVNGTLCLLAVRNMKENTFDCYAVFVLYFNFSE